MALIEKNKGKIAFTMILLAVLVIFMFFAGTSKAESSVIEINTAEDLAKIGMIWMDPDYSENGNYVLMKDIDLSDFGNWKPIDRFSGTFDGNGKTIIGLSSDKGGLFNQVYTGGKIRNLTLSNVDINSASVYIGALVGRNYYGTIENVSVNGGSVIANSMVGGLVGVNEGTITDSVASVNVHGVNGYAGGMVGDNRDGRISRSSTSGEVTGKSMIGGFAGNAVGTFEEIIATGDVSGDSDVGGLIGMLGNLSPLSDSRAEGDVSGNTSIGGLVGGSLSGSTILRSHAIGNVTATGRDAGGLIGQSGGDVSDSQATGHVTGEYNVGGLTGSNNGTITHSQSTGNVLGTSQIGGLVGQNNSTLTDSSSSGNVNGTYEVGGLIGSGNGLFSSGGGGSVNNSYATGTVEALDPTASKIGGLIGGSSQSVENSYATGTVTSNGTQVGGLIGNQYMKKVANSYALGNVIGKSYVGGLIGYGDSIPLEHTFATGVVEGEDNVGGLAGYLKNNATLTNNFATGQVTGVENVGGLVGQSTDHGNVFSFYSNVSAFGDVSGQTNVGGLAGSCGCFIDLSFAAGNITGSGGSGIGGLVGSASSGSIKNSYASGNINDSSSQMVGGLAGYIRNSVDWSYAMGNVITGGTSYGGLVGLIQYPELVNNSYHSGNVSGGNNLGKKLTEQQLKQVDQLQGFTFVTSSLMGNPWLIVPGETAPFSRNGHAVQPDFHLNSPIAPTVSVGDNLEFSGQVSLQLGVNAQYEDPRMRPLYVFYTILDQNGETKETKVIVSQPNPGTVESFNGSVSIDSTFVTNQPYTLEIWAMTKKGGVSVSKHNFGVFAPADIELEAKLPDDSYYTENEWTGRNVIVSASFGNDIPSKRQYAVTGPSVADSASVSGWQSYVEPIELKDSGEYIVWTRSENGMGGVAHQSYRVRIDKELPGIPSLLRTGAITADGWTNGSDVVTITDGTDTLSGSDYSEYRLGASGTWTRYMSGIHVNDEGLTMIYARTVDKAGNTGVEVEIEVKIDLTAPSEVTLEVTSPLGVDGWASGSVMVTLTDGTDALSGVDYTEYKLGTSGTWTKYTASIQVTDEGLTKIYARSVDKVGNIGAEAELEVKIDLTVPSGVTLDATGTIGADGWASGPVTVTLTEGTDTLSGVDYTEYKLGTSGTWTKYTASIQVADEGLTKIYARSVDKVGNIGAEAELEVKIDLTTPSEVTLDATGTIGAEGWASGPVTVTITAGTDTLSGVDYTEYKLGASGTWTKYAAGIQVADEGLTKIVARTVDKAGNIGEEAELEVKIDLTTPSKPMLNATGLIGPDGWASGSVTVTITGGTDMLSGVDYTEYRLGVSGIWTQYAAGIQVDDEGLTKIYARTVDKAGNVGDEAELEVKIDLTSPSEPTIDATGTIGASGWASVPVTITITDGADTLSGVDYTEYKLGTSGIWTQYAAGIQVDDEGITKIVARTVDKAGNISEEAELEVKIDRTGPTEPTIDATGTIGAGGWASGPVIVTLTEGTDTLSSMDYTEYKIGASGTWTRYMSDIQVNDEGVTKIVARTVDMVGNIGNEAELEVKIDLTSPTEPTIDATGVIGASGWANGPVTVTLTEGKDTLSGVDYTEYRLGMSGTWTKYTASIQVDDEGITKIVARTVDKTGNIGEEAELEVKIDLTPPSGPTIDLAGPSAPNGIDSWYAGPVTVSIADGADSLSGTDYTEYKIGNGDWTKFTAPFTVGEAYEATIYARTVDKVGNIGYEEARKVMITSKRPSPPSSGGGGGYPASNPEPPVQGNLTLSAGSAGSIEQDQTIFISIPAGATDRELRFTLGRAEVQPAIPAELAAERISEVYELSVDALERFQSEITLTIVIDSSELKTNQTAEIFLYDEKENKWVSIGGTLEGDRLSAMTDRVAPFAVFTVNAIEKDEPVPTFADTKGHWAEASIQEAITQGIVKGYASGTFKPNQSVSRAEFIVMLMNALKQQEEDEELEFSDKQKIGAWAASAIAQAVAAGIVNGYGDGSFGPDRPITRAEMTMMLANALGIRMNHAVETGFADDGTIPAWAKDAAESLRALGIVNGRAGNQFAPNDRASRAEAITVILRMLKLQDG
jgi:hypothetical protein